MNAIEQTYLVLLRELEGEVEMLDALADVARETEGS